MRRRRNGLSGLAGIVKTEKFSKCVGWEYGILYDVVG